MQSVNRLLVDSVHLEFDKLQVLQSAFITAQTGRVTGVLGRNGCGKSCLFKCIMGGIKPQNIFVRFNDEPETDYAHIGKRVKYLPQNVFIPANMTLGEAVGVSRQTINFIETGRYMPSTVVALKIARYFGRHADEIFQLEEND